MLSVACVAAAVCGERGCFTAAMVPPGGAAAWMASGAGSRSADGIGGRSRLGVLLWCAERGQRGGRARARGAGEGVVQALQFLVLGGEP
jgi:hypothetical protein